MREKIVLGQTTRADLLALLGDPNTRVTMNSYEKSQYADAGYLGVTMAEDGDEIVVMQVVDGSPAQLAGLERGDVIARLDGRHPKNAAEARTRLARHNPGDAISIAYLRSGQSFEVQAVLSQHPMSGLSELWTYSRMSIQTKFRSLGLFMPGAAGLGGAASTSSDYQAVIFWINDLGVVFNYQVVSSRH